MAAYLNYLWQNIKDTSCFLAPAVSGFNKALFVFSAAWLLNTYWTFSDPSYVFSVAILRRPVLISEAKEDEYKAHDIVHRVHISSNRQTFDQWLTDYLSRRSHCIGTGPCFLIWSGPTPQTRKGPKTCISFISTEGALKRPITYDQSPASAWGLQAIPFFSRWKYENFHPLYPKGEGLGRPTIQYTLWKNSSMLPTGQRKHPPTFI